MRILKNVTVIKKEIDEVACNMCGNKIEKDCNGKFFDYLQVEKRWGYNSEQDGEEHSFDLCESCYKEIIDKFKIPIK